MMAQYWYDAAVSVRPAPLEDDGKLVWLAASTMPDASYGYMASMSIEQARNLRDALNAALNGMPE